MRVLLFGVDTDLGFAVAKRLIAGGDRVTAPTVYPASSWRKSGVKAFTTDHEPLKQLQDPRVQHELAKAEAVIDVVLPAAWHLERVHLSRLRPILLRRSLAGSGRTVLVSSSAAVLGDTGPVPVGEKARANSQHGFAWVSRFEKEILTSPNVRGIVIRPAWHIHGGKMWFSVELGIWINLALALKTGIYIGSGENRYSAAHYEDLADLYYLALRKCSAGTLLHGAAENFTMRELAAAIHRGLRLKGEPSSLSLEKARRCTNVDLLIQSHALSSDLAKQSLGWRPFRDSIMKEIEFDAYASRGELGRVRLPRIVRKTGTRSK